MTPADGAGEAHVSFTLIENAFDFLLSAAEHVRQDTERALKHALLDLVACVGLILKARLYREDWKLVFRDPGKASESALRRGEFKSVDFDGALERLEEIGVDLEQVDITHLLTGLILRFSFPLKPVIS